MNDFELQSHDFENEKEIDKEELFIREYIIPPHLPASTSQHISELLDAFLQRRSPDTIERLKKISHEVRWLLARKDELNEKYKNGASSSEINEIISKAQISVAEIIWLLSGNEK